MIRDWIKIGVSIGILRGHTCGNITIKVGYGLEWQEKQLPTILVDRKIGKPGNYVKHTICRPS